MGNRSSGAVVEDDSSSSNRNEENVGSRDERNATSSSTKSSFPPEIMASSRAPAAPIAGGTADLLEDDDNGANKEASVEESKEEETFYDAVEQIPEEPVKKEGVEKVVEKEDSLQKKKEAKVPASDDKVHAEIQSYMVFFRGLTEDLEKALKQRQALSLPKEVIINKLANRLNDLRRADGRREIQLKRKIAGEGDQKPPAKRQKINGDDLICPLNGNLPVDSVNAEDGRVYEGEAIENWFHLSKERKGVEDLQNFVEGAIMRGATTGELAEEKDMEAMLNLFKKTEYLFVGAMCKAGWNYECGKNGFTQDKKMAFKWYDNARDAGSLHGMGKVGLFLVRGWGVAKDTSKGMMFLGKAADQGSDMAAFFTGSFMATGKHGVLVDKMKARQLLEKCLSGSCSTKEMTASTKQRAQQYLDKLMPIIVPVRGAQR